MTPTDSPLREQLEFADTDALLRDDVRRLGTMVGDMLAEQVSPEFLDRVEEVRRTAIARREQGEPVDALAERLAEVPLEQAEALVRAFAAYFGTTNIAERVHRIRRRRDYQRMASAPQPSGLHAVLQDLRDAGVGLPELQDLLSRTCIEPVFTAHPTEAIRRALLLKEHMVVDRLIADIDHTHTPPERRRRRRAHPPGADHQLADQRSRPRRSRASPTRSSTSASTWPACCIRVLPVFYEDFATAVEAVYGERIALPPLLRFGTWVGGDMDGNPNVGRRHDTRRAGSATHAGVGELPGRPARARRHPHPEHRPGRGRRRHRGARRCPSRTVARRRGAGPSAPGRHALSAIAVGDARAPARHRCRHRGRLCRCRQLHRRPGTDRRQPGRATAATMPAASRCGACCGARARSASTWRRSTCARIRRCTTRRWARWMAASTGRHCRCRRASIACTR